MKITENEVLEWLGSDVDIKECVSIITDVANGNYKKETLKSDIIETVR